jgi:S-formylglutathione hydrolase FrmB
MTILYALVLIATRFALAAPEPSASAAAAQMSCSSLPSAILGRAVGYCVAFPPGFDASAAKRYPTLYFLHGLFEDDQRWSERGGEQLWQDLTARGEIGRFLVVLPDAGKTFYVNSLDGRDRYEDFFIKELVPAVDRMFPTLADRTARGITGTSMGGYGALHLGMRHPDVFGSASAHSAALLPKFPNPIPSEGRWGFYARILQGPFGSPLNEAYWEANSPLTLAEHPEQFAGLKLYFDCGDQDRYGFDEGARLLDQILNAHGFAHEFAIRPGGHGWDYLLQYMPFSLRFHWQSFHQAEENGKGKPEDRK